MPPLQLLATALALHDPHEPKLTPICNPATQSTSHFSPADGMTIRLPPRTYILPLCRSTVLVGRSAFPRNRRPLRSSLPRPPPASLAPGEVRRRRRRRRGEATAASVQRGGPWGGPVERLAARTRALRRGGASDLSRLQHRYAAGTRIIRKRPQRDSRDKNDQCHVPNYDYGRNVFYAWLATS